jgi:hypothetical protein
MKDDKGQLKKKPCTYLSEFNEEMIELAKEQISTPTFTNADVLFYSYT